MGTHVLYLLLQQPHVARIYCLVRGKDPSHRLRQRLDERQLSLPNSGKFSAFSSDLSEPYLGLSSSDYDTISSTTTHIIHCAWPVNFQLSLSSFIPSLQGLHSLIQLSLSSPFHIPPHLLFCSSISVALGTPSPARIPEAHIESLDQVSDTGYAASKLVAERIIEAAARDYGLKTAIMRIGQVVGDTKTGIWNDNEAFPLIIRSALTMHMLPEIKISERWLPVDTVAKCVLSTAGLQADSPIADQTVKQAPRFYNIRSPHRFSWTRHLLPALHKSSLPPFENVPFETWIARLRGLSALTNSRGDAADPEKNPALKLVDFLAGHFSGDKGGWDVEFETGVAEWVCEALMEGEYVVGRGRGGKMVGVWMEKWEKVGE